MTWIKICGITNLEDALTAVEGGADAVGFVFYEKSPRRVEAETAREIVSKLPSHIEKVGVFAGDGIRNASQIADHCKLTAVQIYKENLMPVPGAPRLTVDESGNQRAVYPTFTASWLVAHGLNHDFGTLTYTFLDSGKFRQYGGTGVAFNWAEVAPIMKKLRERTKFVIAGGLNAENVVTAMRTLKPFGVDVASGVEALPGKKDPEKVRAFINAVRAEDKLT
jgi:phosphoribosylanthranilate isomerase